MKNKIIRTILIGLVGSALLVATGCNTINVQPWERGTLSEYSMRPDRDPLALAMNEHTFFSREATSGGRGVGGSGCGCN